MLVSQGVLELYNPYHDERGRFATKEANRIIGAYREIVNVEPAKNNALGWCNDFDPEIRRVHKSIQLVPKDVLEKIATDCVGVVAEDGRIFIDKDHASNRDLLQQTIAHEILHKRPRVRDGSMYLNIKDRIEPRLVKRPRWMEESLTEMLAAKLTHDNGRDTGMISYISFIDNMSAYISHATDSIFKDNPNRFVQKARADMGISITSLLHKNLTDADSTAKYLRGPDSLTDFNDIANAISKKYNVKYRESGIVEATKRLGFGLFGDKYNARVDSTRYPPVESSESWNFWKLIKEMGDFI